MAVSEIVGEMIMLAVVLILLAVFSASLSSYLPPPRDPSITIMMEDRADTISLYHKGGDWIKSADLWVIVETDDTGVRRYRPGLNDEVSVVPLNGDASGHPGTFDLGDRIEVNKTAVTGEDWTIRLVTSRAVLFCSGGHR